MGYQELYVELRKDADEQEEHLRQMADALTELEMRLEMQDLCWGLTDHLAPKWFIETAADFGAVEDTSSSDASPD